MKTEINSGMKTTEMLTCGIFYCRDSAEINGCGSLQTSSWLDSDMLRNRQQKHTANLLCANLENRYSKNKFKLIINGQNIKSNCRFYL